MRVVVIYRAFEDIINDEPAIKDINTRSAIL